MSRRRPARSAAAGAPQPACRADLYRLAHEHRGRPLAEALGRALDRQEKRL